MFPPSSADGFLPLFDPPVPVGKLVSRFPSAWEGVFDGAYSRGEFEALLERVEEAYRAGDVCPPADLVFRALECVRPAEVRVAIVGQDPYPTPGNADGLAFSVSRAARLPGSLRTLYRELERSVDGWRCPPHGSLDRWSRQGVLLLNTVLTTRAGDPMSHGGLGWQAFTRAVLRHVQRAAPFVVFMLWGQKAIQAVGPVVDEGRHLVLRSSHPSPLSENRAVKGQGFVGNDHFAEANRQLVKRGLAPVEWSLA